MKAWHNGKFVNWEETHLSPLSHSFSRGSAIFEVVDLLSTPKGAMIFGLREHVERFYNSARLCMMEIPLQPEELIRRVVETVQENRVKRGSIKFFAYYADIELKLTPSQPQVSLTIFVVDFDQLNIPQSELSKVVNVKISEIRKSHPETVPIKAKVSGAYLNPYVAKMEAHKSGYDDVILLDTMGYVAEGTTANLFLVFGDKVVTPTSRSILLGITRRAIIDTLKAIPIVVEERDVLPSELRDCSEAFFTSSVAKIQPIRAIDGRELDKSCPGKVTKALIDHMSLVFNGEFAGMTQWLTYV